MSYSCTVYKNTGFVGGNIPDSPALLGTGAAKQALEILQDGELTTIRIAIGWDEAKQVDYIKVGNVYYMVNARGMLATDVCEFAVLEDGISTIGGVSQIQILDGITERCHLPNSADGDKNDPLLAPQDPLLLETQIGTNADETVVMVEATASPIDTYFTKKALVYEGVGNGEVAAVPQVVPYDQSDLTLYEMPTYYQLTEGGTVQTKNVSINRGTALEIMSTRSLFDWDVMGYDTDGNVIELNPDDYIREGVATLRSLGVEATIISQFEYPTGLVDIVVEEVDETQPATHTHQKVRKVKSRQGTYMNADELPFIYSSNVNNDILFMSDYTKYGIIAASGSKAEFSIKSIKNPNQTLAQQVNPVIDYFSDPNPDGKPYYRYHYFNGDASKINFLINAIPGLSWKQIPLVFTDKSGSYLDRLEFETSRYLDERNFQARRATNAISTAASIATNVSSGITIADNSPSFEGNAKAGALASIISYGANNLYENEAYRNQKFKSLVDFEVSQVASPQLNFPYNSEPLRVQLNNGIIAYRYKYSANDLARIDKLITMYGVKTTQALTPSMFTSRRYFNFVKCDDVTVIGNTRHLNEVVSAQLRGGVRIWHTKPDPALYLTENI